MSTTPGTTLRGREYDKAVTAIDHACGLTYSRAETARKAVAATLAYIGARRIVAATRGETDAAEDRHILGLCAQIETDADSLDRIPCRTECGTERNAAWETITGRLTSVKARLGMDHHLRDQKRD